jgi:anaerobic magnesium-protoporphyrin IX monomethyl ester cyclase
MREAGCDSVSFGVETGNSDLLKVIRKGITREQVREAVSLCRETGIIAHTSFIVGLPGETPETLKETGEFAASLGSLYGYHFLAPFPGTTIREEVEKYDLEIVTDDWTRYDANSAIVRTSRLTPEEMDRFVAEFESTLDAAWQEMVTAYHKKTNPPGIGIQVEGHFRMNLVFRILNEDLIEKMGSISLALSKISDRSEEASLGVICRRIEEATGVNGELIRKTLFSLADSGYIKAAITEEILSWHWTHNRHVDRMTKPPGSNSHMAPVFL